MRILAFVLALALAPAALAAEVRGIDVVDRGIYVIETGAATPDAGTPTGTITAVETARLTEATTTVPARLGLEFGIRYVVRGAPEGAEVALDMVMTYPPQGLSDPGAAAPVRESRYRRVKAIGETAYLGYGFEAPWEIEPGTWTFEIWHDGRRLAGESFTVVK